ncbi:hypothetical protein KFK09_003210 [Dendrobium nobile]|uniref:Uncharacterized protein n=1 Tax=Dendrobium nobile TaxID=94219 RepID=A0A8T3C6Z8_DENNO|nr:hypothetical protein KFK09_003210 [Dendrobium nobile]
MRADGFLRGKLYKLNKASVVMQSGDKEGPEGRWLSLGVRMFELNKSSVAMRSEIRRADCFR